MRRWGIIVSWWIAACGPSVSTASSAEEGGGSTESTESTSSAAATSSSSADATTAQATTVTSATISGGASSSIATGDTDIGASCDDAAYPRPPTPRGCTAIPLADEKGGEIPGSHSGLVRCPEAGAPKKSVYSIFRTGKVACPFNTGACLCDADCGPTEQCMCNFAGKSGLLGPGNVCVAADCDSDADCDGQRCRADVVPCGTYDLPHRFHCTSPEDDCDAHTTCIEVGESYCDYDTGDEIFTCSPGAVCE